MRILDRLVVSTFLKLFLAFLISAPLLFILGDATENLDRYLSQGVSFRNALVSYMYEYPKFFFWSFPIAGMLATVFTIHPMTTNREIMAAKAGGVSFYRLMAPLVVMGVVLTGVGLALAEVAPRATRIAGELRGDREIGQAWRSDFVYITEAGESLSARRLTVDDGRMVGVSLRRLPTDPDAPTTFIQAEMAQWREGRGWLFEGGVSRRFYSDERESTVGFQSALIRSLTERPEELLEVARDEDEMTYSELKSFGDRLLRSGGSVGRTYTKMEERLAIPAATLVIILFGAPLATSSRRGGTAFGVGLSLATTIAYLALLRFSQNLGYAGSLDPRVASWLPNVVFFLAGLALLKRVRT